MNKPTVHDIAREAGVSLATVDRVLNARPGVRDRTIARVQDAVSRLGYVRDTSAANLARQKLYRFVMVLPEGSSQFVTSISTALQEAQDAQVLERTAVRTISVPAHDPHAVVHALRSLDTAHLDGVAIMAPETPQVRDAVARLKADGVVVVTLISDLPNSERDRFVGINSLCAGRTAGLLMGRFVRGAGTVLVVTNSMSSRDSLERRLGFDHVLSERFPDLVVLPSLESHDDPDRMTAIVGSAITGNPNLKGIYSMGFGNRPLLEAIRRVGRARGLIVLAHELTPTTRQALVDDEITAVIMQNVGHLVRSTLRVMRNLCEGIEIYEAQETVRIEIVLKENIP